MERKRAEWIDAKTSVADGERLGFWGLLTGGRYSKKQALLIWCVTAVAYLVATFVVFPDWSILEKTEFVVPGSAIFVLLLVALEKSLKHGDPGVKIAKTLKNKEAFTCRVRLQKNKVLYGAFNAAVTFGDGVMRVWSTDLCFDLFPSDIAHSPLNKRQFEDAPRYTLSDEHECAVIELENIRVAKGIDPQAPVIEFSNRFRKFMSQTPPAYTAPPLLRRSTRRQKQVQFNTNLLLCIGLIFILIPVEWWPQPLHLGVTWTLILLLPTLIWRYIVVSKQQADVSPPSPKTQPS